MNILKFIATFTHQKWRKFILCLNKDGLCLYLLFISVELGRYKCIRNLLLNNQRKSSKHQQSTKFCIAISAA